MPSGDGEIRRLADWFLHAVRVGNDTLLITLLFARRTVSPPIEPRLRSAEIERGGIEIEAVERSSWKKRERRVTITAVRSNVEESINVTLY